MSEEVTRKMVFKKTVDGMVVATCTLELFEDGSVYVVGDDFGELIIEYAPDSLGKAVSHLNEQGYFNISAAE